MAGSNNNRYIQALSGRKIPILTLDHNWHKLFAMSRITPEVSTLEREVNGLLKKEAQVREELKKCKALKKQLMEEIISSAEQIGTSENKKLLKESEQKKKLIEEINEKMDELQDQMLELPSQIELANYNLMIQSMSECSRRFADNYDTIKECNNWIVEIKNELKEKIIKKQEREKDSYELFRYMKQYFEEDTFSVFELKYNPEKFAPKKQKNQGKKQDNKTGK